MKILSEEAAKDFALINDTINKYEFLTVAEMRALSVFDNLGNESSASTVSTRLRSQVGYVGEIFKKLKLKGVVDYEILPGTQAPLYHTLYVKDKRIAKAE